MRDAQPTILVLGSTISKLVWIDQAKKIADLGFRTIFFVRKKVSDSPENSRVKTVEVPNNIFCHWLRFFKVLKSSRPHHIEAFHDLYRWDFLLSYWIYVWLAKIFRIPIVSVCMGGEILYWEKHFFLKKWSIKTLLRASKHIIVKEPYHREYIEKYKILGKKKINIVEIPNATDIREEFDVKRKEDIVLYLNSFKTWRHPEVVVQAFKLIKKKIPDALLIMAGYRTEEELARIRESMDSETAPSIRYIPYDFENRKLFSQAKIFLLPAELVYVNNSLLEAMERGVPPVIGNVDPYGEKIVRNGENGFAVDITPEAVAEKSVLLLENEDLRQKLGRNARDTVTRHFNNRIRIQSLLELYKSLE